MLALIGYLYLVNALIIALVPTILAGIEAFDDIKFEIDEYNQFLVLANNSRARSTLPPVIYVYLLALLKYLPVKLVLGFAVGVFIGLFWPVALLQYFYNKISN